MFIDLSHVIVDGMATYPGLPVPIIEDHLSLEAAEPAPFEHSPASTTDRTT